MNDATARRIREAADPTTNPYLTGEAPIFAGAPADVAAADAYLTGLVHGVALTEGVDGDAVLAAALGADALLYPRTTVTVEVRA